MSLELAKEIRAAADRLWEFARNVDEDSRHDYKAAVDELHYIARKIERGAGERPLAPMLELLDEMDRNARARGET